MVERWSPKPQVYVQFIGLLPYFFNKRRKEQMDKMAIEIRIAKLKERGTANQNIIRKLERQLRKIETGER